MTAQLLLGTLFKRVFQHDLFISSHGACICHKLGCISVYRPLDTGEVVLS